MWPVSLELLWAAAVFAFTLSHTQIRGGGAYVLEIFGDLSFGLPWLSASDWPYTYSQTYMG